MTLLTVCQSVALSVGQRMPLQVIGDPSRSSFEFQNIAREMGQRIAWDGPDWPLIQKMWAVTSDAAPNATSFRVPLPADFKRMLRISSVLTSNMPASALMHCTDAQVWNALNWQGVTGTGFPGMWLMIPQQGVIEIRPAPPAGTIIAFPYIHSKIAQTWKPSTVPTVDDTQWDTFHMDTDYFVLDERLLTLGMIWQWRAHKGSAYAEDEATYQTALSNSYGSYKGTAEILKDTYNYIKQYRTAQSYPYATPASSPYPL